MTVRIRPRGAPRGRRRYGAPSSKFERCLPLTRSYFELALMSVRSNCASAFGRQLPGDLRRVADAEGSGEPGGVEVSAVAETVSNIPISNFHLIGVFHRLVLFFQGGGAPVPKSTLMLIGGVGQRLGVAASRTCSLMPTAILFPSVKARSGRWQRHRARLLSADRIGRKTGRHPVLLRQRSSGCLPEAGLGNCKK